MPNGSPSGKTFQGFLRTLNGRLHTLAHEIADGLKPGKDFEFVMPIGMFLVLDKENGGDVTAQELVRRFQLLHAESKNAIDFYFLGWQWIAASDHSKGIKFDLASFTNCRNALAKVGVKSFGGSADLILVDVRYRHRAAKRDPKGVPTPYGYVEQDFNFPEAIHINLATSRERREIPPIGDLLQSIIAVAEDLREQGGSEKPVYAISDALGIATAKRSLLDYLLKKWGALIGANKLAVLAVRNLGPVARFTGEIEKDNVLAPGDIPALSLPRGRNAVTGVDN